MRKPILLSGNDKETEKLNSIIQSRITSNWEYLVTAELLEKRLTILQWKYDELKKIKIKSIDKTHYRAYIDWFAAFCDIMDPMPNTLGKLITKDLTEAFGPDGKPGNAKKIKKTVEQIVFHCEQLYNIEREIRIIRPAKEFATLHKKMNGVTIQWFQEMVNIKNYFREYDLKLQQSNNATHMYKLNLDLPKQMVAMSEEVKNISTAINNKMAYYQTSSTINPPSNHKKKSVSKSSASSTVRDGIGIVTKILRLFR